MLLRLEGFSSTLEPHCCPLPMLASPGMSSLPPGRQQSPHRTQQCFPLSLAARLLLWPTGPLEAPRGGRCFPSLEWSSRAWPVLCQAPGNLVMLAQAAHTCHLETASHLDLPLHMRDRSTLLPSSSESPWPHPTPPQGWQGRGYTQSEHRAPVSGYHIWPLTTSFLTALSPSPIRPEKPQICSQGQEALLYLNRFASKQIVCLSVLPIFPCLTAQLCLTLCNCSPPGSSVYGILQARIRKWVSIPFSRGFSQSRDWTWVSCIAGRFFTNRAILLGCLKPLKFQTGLSSPPPFHIFLPRTPYLEAINTQSG